MQRKTRAVVLLGCLWPSGCAANPVSVHATNNDEVPVEKLFTHEGCTVYRFKDVGYHYYVRCDGPGIAMTHSREPCGKGCVVNQDIPTFEDRGDVTASKAGP